MKSVKINIAATGSFSVGKTTAVTLIKDLIQKELGTDVIVLPSIPRMVVDLTGFDPKTVDNDEFQLYSLFFRRHLQLESLKQPIPLLSERCGLDEVAFQAYRCDDLVKKANSGILVPSQGGGSVQWQNDLQAQYTVAHAALQTLIQQTVYELSGFWNAVYRFKPSGIKIEDDGVRPTDPEYQAAIEEKLDWAINSIGIEGIKEVPSDLADQKEFFELELRNEWVPLILQNEENLTEIETNS